MSYFLKTKHKIKLSINDFLPRGNGPGFNSTPDIIKSFWVTLDMTNRYDNIIKDSIRVFVVSLFPKVALPMVQVNFFLEKVPILDLY